MIRTELQLPAELLLEVVSYVALIPVAQQSHANVRPISTRQGDDSESDEEYANSSTETESSSGSDSGLSEGSSVDEDIMDAYFSRESALRSLSQSSRTLRAICLPLLWECIRVTPHHGGRKSASDLDKRMVRIAGGLAANPALAQHVR